MSIKTPREQYIISLETYATHRKNILNFDTWFDAIQFSKHNKEVKKIREDLNNILNTTEEYKR